MDGFSFTENMTEKLVFTVSEEQTARALGSGKSDILATPALVALVEATAQKIVDRAAPSNWQSVGSYIALEHNAMTPVGMEVEIEVVLSGMEGRELTFTVSARDEKEMISVGTHKRVLSRTDVLNRLLKRKSKIN